MCLTIKKNQGILTAKKDIICYKLVEDGFDSGSLTTPYHYYPIVLGETYTSNIVREHNSINEGIHSYVKLGYALRYLRAWRATMHIIKCIIPKGSRYIRGTFDHDDEAIASDTIVYTKEILVTCHSYEK